MGLLIAMIEVWTTSIVIIESIQTFYRYNPNMQMTPTTTADNP